MFKTRFELIEIRDNGVRITHYFVGKKKEVKKDVDAFKNLAKDYMVVNKNTMIVWM